MPGSYSQGEFCSICLGYSLRAFQAMLVVKNLSVNAGDLRSLGQASMCPGLGFPSSGPVPLGTEAPCGPMLPGRGLRSSPVAPPDPGWGPGGTRSGHLV